MAKGVAALLDEPLTNPAFADIYRWRYALPVKKEDAQLLNELTLPFDLAFCGDAFVGGGIHLTNHLTLLHGESQTPTEHVQEARHSSANLLS